MRGNTEKTRGGERRLHRDGVKLVSLVVKSNQNSRLHKQASESSHSL